MRQVRQIMGMPVSVDIIGCKSKDIFNDVFDEFARIDNKFSPFKKDSELSKFQSGEIKEADLSPEMKIIIARCKKAEELTDGYFSAWYSDITYSHADAMRREPAGATGLASGQGKAVRGRGFDPTGYVKGYAINRAGGIIKKAGYKTFCVGAGGDILASSDRTKKWRIGIQDPAHPLEILNMLSISNGAVATSGNYERGEHIVNPTTDKPANDLLSFTVIGPDIISADVFATAGFAMGKAGIGFINKKKGYKAMAIDNIQKVTCTKNW